MEYIVGTEDFQLKNTIVTLGKFDGFHKGHQLLLNKLLEEQKNGYHSVVFTFRQHPNALFSNHSFSLIYTEEEKRALLEQMGMDYLISFPFNEETAAISPEEFIERILVRQMDARIIVVGNDYRFGAKRRGDVALLKKQSSCYGYTVMEYDKLQMDGKVISSSLIRADLKAGKMQQAASRLGRNYSICGAVKHGNQFGRTQKVPTINLEVPPEKLLPPNGVYTVKAYLEDKIYEGITNIGYKPTVQKENRVLGVETFLFQFSGDVYGKQIKVEFLNYQRPEIEFSEVVDLYQQVEQDVLQAKQYLAQAK